jgi:uncharacterized membrane protein HdeD (DUF308 family)
VADVNTNAMFQIRLYLVRGLLALAWALTFAAGHDPAMTGTVLLLVAYPLIDVVASALDARAARGTPARTLQLINTVLSALAAIALGVAGPHGDAAVLVAFGGWAIVSGAAQVTVALRRRGELGRQWPMRIAGALSVIAGATYLVSAAGDHPALTALITYTTAGGTFFVIQAVLLAVRTRRARAIA